VRAPLPRPATGRPAVLVWTGLAYTWLVARGAGNALLSQTEGLIWGAVPSGGGGGGGGGGPWGASGYTATADTVAGFDGTGAATTYPTGAAGLAVLASDTGPDVRTAISAEATGVAANLLFLHTDVDVDPHPEYVLTSEVLGRVLGASRTILAVESAVISPTFTVLDTFELTINDGAYLGVL
jgi:hypothetical protein